MNLFPGDGIFFLKMARIGIFFTNFLKFYFISCCFCFNAVLSVSYIDFQTVADCKTGVEQTHEFFDISQLRCRACAQNATAQTVSEDGMSLYVFKIILIVQFL